MAWAREARRDRPLALLVHLDRPAAQPDEGVLLREAVRRFFTNRALSARRRLRDLFRRGRKSLVIGMTFLATLVGIAKLLARWSGGPFATITHQGLVIGGWVAMWRPLEVFLYDWWPISAEARLFDRLAAMPVVIRYGPDRSDVRRDD